MSCKASLRTTNCSIVSAKSIPFIFVTFSTDFMPSLIQNYLESPFYTCCRYRLSQGVAQLKCFSMQLLVLGAPGVRVIAAVLT